MKLVVAHTSATTLNILLISIMDGRKFLQQLFVTIEHKNIFEMIGKKQKLNRLASHFSPFSTSCS